MMGEGSKVTRIFASQPMEAVLFLNSSTPFPYGHAAAITNGHDLSDMTFDAGVAANYSMCVDVRGLPPPPFARRSMHDGRVDADA
jgi:hypothetical protein